MQIEERGFHDTIDQEFRIEGMIGASRVMRELYQKIHQVANSDTTVLVRGESGTGKELVASAIHVLSPRRTNKLVKVNCAALNMNLLESELFGHEKGAYTGARSTRIGRIEEAGGGTLFLDEIGDMPCALQVKLLRFLQQKEFERVGSNTTLKANVRIVATTSRDLEQAIAKATLRADFYYRISVFPIYLPPLRERREDIAPLADYFVKKYASKIHKYIDRISASAMTLLREYHWPGNVRELENCIERAVLLCSDTIIHEYDLPLALQRPMRLSVRPGGSLKERIEALEKDLIIDALRQSKGSIAAAGIALGLSGRMIRYKIHKLQIDYKKYCPGTSAP